MYIVQCTLYIFVILVFYQDHSRHDIVHFCAIHIAKRTTFNARPKIRPYKSTKFTLLPEWFFPFRTEDMDEVSNV